jgi:hypothetical protein
LFFGFICAGIHFYIGIQIQYFIGHPPDFNWVSIGCF